MNGAEIPDEIPDLIEERARRAVRRWLLEDQESHALLADLEDDPIGGEIALKERVEQSAPAEVKTYLRMSGGSVEKLVNVAKAEQLHIHNTPSVERPLVRLFSSRCRQSFKLVLPNRWSLWRESPTKTPWSGRPS